MVLFVRFIVCTLWWFKKKSQIGGRNWPCQNIKFEVFFCEPDPQKRKIFRFQSVRKSPSSKNDWLSRCSLHLPLNQKNRNKQFAVFISLNKGYSTTIGNKPSRFFFSVFVFVWILFWHYKSYKDRYTSYQKIYERNSLMKLLRYNEFCSIYSSKILLRTSKKNPKDILYAHRT